MCLSWVCADVCWGCVPVCCVLLCMCIAGLQWLLYNFAGAVHRYYESRRRLFLDSQPERVERARTTRRNSKNKALRKQVWDTHLVNFLLSVIISICHTHSRMTGERGYWRGIRSENGGHRLTTGSWRMKVMLMMSSVSINWHGVQKVHNTPIF